jgi:hypothetical protein
VFLRISSQVRVSLVGNIDFADLTDVSSLPTVLKLIKIPQLVKQACDLIGTISENAATSDMDTIQQLAAPPIVMALADALASDRRSACAAAEAVRALVRHDVVRGMLFRHGIVATLYDLLVSKPPICTAAVSVCGARSVPQAALDSIIDSAVTSANELPTAIVEAATAVIHAEKAPERNSKRTEWFAARPYPTHPELRGRLMIGETEAAHRLAVLDEIALPLASDSGPASTETTADAVGPQSSIRRYKARARAARKARLRERNWAGGSRCPVVRKPTEPAGGAMERERNLRIERAQRADLQLYRELTKAAEDRKKLGSIRVAEARLKKRLGIGTLPP